MPLVLKLDKHNLKILFNNFIRLKLDKHNLKILFNNFIRSSLILSIITNANSLISFFSSEWYSILNAPLQSNPTIQTQNPGNPSLLSNQVYPSPSFPENQVYSNSIVQTVPPPNHLTLPPPSHLTLPPPSYQTIPPLSHQTVPHLSSILVQEPQSSWIQSEQICGSTVFPAQSSFSTSTLPILLQTDLSQSQLEAESFPTAYPEYSDVNPSLYDNQVMYPVKSLSTPIPESTLSETSLVDSFSQQRTKIRLNLVNSDLYGKTFPSEQDTLPVTERESTTPLLDENIPEKFQVFYTFCCDPFQFYLKEENLRKNLDFFIFFI